MNKKFFTLIAAMLFGAFTVNAADAIEDTKGAYVFLKDASDNYLALDRTLDGKNDSIVVVNTNDATSLDAKALWAVTFIEVTQGGDNVFSLVNKDKGVTLSVDKKANAPLIIKPGVDTWVITADGKISSTFAIMGSTPTLAFKVATGLVFDADKANATAFEMVVPDKKTLTADELGTELTSFALNINGTFVENIFAGKQITAIAGEGDYVKLQIVGEEKIGKKDAFLSIDTILQDLTPHSGAFGATFTVDTVWADKAVGVASSIGNANFQLFKLVLDPGTDKLAIFVKDAPAFNTDNKVYDVASAEQMIVSQTVAGRTILTVGSHVTGSPTQGKAVDITFDKGTPTTFSGETGVYFIYYLNDKGERQYVYGDTTTTAPGASPTGTKFVVKKDAPKATSPAGQFYVVVSEDSKTIQAAERNYNAALTGAIASIAAAELYEGADGSYRLDKSPLKGKDLFFEAQDIAAGNPDKKANQFYYFETINITPEDAAKYAYTLNLISGTPGVEDLYTFIADSALTIKGQASVDDAVRFKVDNISVARVTEGLGKAGVGAYSLGDTLGTSTFKLFKQYTTQYVYLDTRDGSKTKNQLLIGAKAEDAGVFTFTYKADGKYLMTYGAAPIMLNVDNSTLIATDDATANNFNLVVIGAPDYADFGGNGHKVAASAEDDNKKLIKDINGINALLNFTADEENYSAYFQRANTDDSKPLYYITTQVGLTEEQKEAGEFFFLTNPAGYNNKFAADDSKFVDAANGLYKAVFMKGELDADTLKLYGSNFGENVKDTLYKDMSGNPAVFAFATTQEGTVKIESNIIQDITALRAATTVTSYITVINNTVLWVTGGEALAKGHEFNVEATEIVPTDNINPEAGFEVYTAAGGVIVKGAANQAAVITNVLGQTIAVQTIGSDYETINLPAGVAFITINGETVKAYVK